MFGRSANGGFRSEEEARRRYLAVYDEMRSLSPEPDVAHEVPTEFGTVRVYQHGPADGDPIVLLDRLQFRLDGLDWSADDHERFAARFRERHRRPDYR